MNNIILNCVLGYSPFIFVCTLFAVKHVGSCIHSVVFFLITHMVVRIIGMDRMSHMYNTKC